MEVSGEQISTYSYGGPLLEQVDVPWRKLMTMKRSTPWSRGKVQEEQWQRAAVMDWSQHPLPSPCTAQGRGSRGFKREGVKLRLGCFSPSHCAFNWQQIKIIFHGQGCFAYDGNWWVTFLSLFWPINIFHLSPLPTPFSWKGGVRQWLCNNQEAISSHLEKWLSIAEFVKMFLVLCQKSFLCNYIMPLKIANNFWRCIYFFSRINGNF